MPDIKPVPRKFFSKVTQAREALKERAIEILESYMALALEAKEKGDFETSAKILWNLMEHMPNEEGTTLIDQSAAKPKQIEGSTGPQIQIGIAMGGLPKYKELPEAQIIDITPVRSDE